MRLDVRCGVLDGGKPCSNKVGAIKRRDLDFAHGVVSFDPLRWEERFYSCPKHGALQIHDQNLSYRALNPSRRDIIARSVRRLGDA